MEQISHTNLLYQQGCIDTKQDIIKILRDQKLSDDEVLTEICKYVGIYYNDTE